jgi:hypothetical protein
MEFASSLEQAIYHKAFHECSEELKIAIEKDQIKLFLYEPQINRTFNISSSFIKEKTFQEFEKIIKIHDSSNNLCYLHSYPEGDKEAILKLHQDEILKIIRYKTKKEDLMKLMEECAGRKFNTKGKIITTILERSKDVDIDSLKNSLILF